jgi:superfamily II DNA or RNA helicase
METSSNGKLNWSSIIQQQSECEERNQLILDIIKHFDKRNILVLCKRVEQGNFLVDELKKAGENVTSLIGSQQEYDAESRILVGTTSKCGTGFDFPKLDTLLLAADIEGYYIQALGRILRRTDSDPVVFDLVDRNPVLEKHFNTRVVTYTNVGGTVKKYTQNQFLKMIKTI